MSKASDALREVKQAIREPYAWPGGYPKYILMSDGATLSIDAAKENWREICRATIAGYRDGWKAECVDVNWEDTDLCCAHTGKRIESAYGES